jgi:6-phosphogluconolactonase
MRGLSTALGIICLAVSTLGVIGAAPAFAKTFVYVSNAEDGDIDGFVMDKESGTLTSLGKTKAGKLVMPMAVSPNKQFLYAVVRSQPFTVVTYAVNPSSGALTQKASAPLPDSMANVATDATGRFLFTASYGGDKVAVSPINATGLVESGAIQVIPTGRYAHAIWPDRSNKFVYATNLASNQILQFLFDAETGKLTPNDPPLIKARPDNGPRHMAFSTYVTNYATETQPRGIKIDPSGKYLVASGEKSDRLSVYKINQTNGQLTLLDRYPVGRDANWVEIVDLP